MKISLGADGALDLDLLMQYGLLVQGRSGSGKTTVIRRILEQSHGHVQQIVIDPEGEFYTLREKYDYVIAGKDGDCAADPRSAKLLARRLMELGVSAICDLYELKMHERIQFVRFFCEALIDAPKAIRRPLLLVIDECHLFASERGQTESLAAVVDVNARGRKRLIRPIFATQRLAKLHKDAADLGNKLIGATGIDLDQQRAGDDLGMTKAERMALRDLPRGAFYAYGPALSPGVSLIHIGETETQNPTVGHDIAAPVPPTAKIRSLLAKVVDLPEQAAEEIRTLEAAQRELKETRRKLTLALKEQRVETAPCDHAAELERYAGTISSQRAQHVLAYRGFAAKRDELDVARRELHQVEVMLRAFPAQTVAERINDFLSKPETFIAPPRAVHQPTTERVRAIEKRADPGRRTPGMESGAALDGQLTGPESRILNAIGWMNRIGVDTPEVTAVAFLAGYTIGGGAFNNPKGRLRQRGLIEYAGDCLRLTDAGRELVTVDDRPLTAAGGDGAAAWARAQAPGSADRQLPRTAHQRAVGGGRRVFGRRWGVQQPARPVADARPRGVSTAGLRGGPFDPVSRLGGTVIQPSVAIIGYGAVGRALHDLFPQAVIHDPPLQGRMVVVAPFAGREAVAQCEFAFVCVPTPANPDGSCDTSIVEEACAWLPDMRTLADRQIVIIRSTVTPGTCHRLASDGRSHIVFQPEYSPAATPEHPFGDLRAIRWAILGGQHRDTVRVADLYKTVFNSDIVIHQTDWRTAELAKYMENAFLAAKVTFCNEFYDLASACGVDYNELRELWLLDPRIGRSHTFVYPEERGFGGKCLPKDLAAILELADRLGLSPTMLRAMEASNNSRT